MSEILADSARALTMTQKEMAKLLGVNQSRISQLIKENIIPRDPATKQPLLFEGLKNYYLSKNATDGEDANFWRERSLHERAKRELAELKLAREKNELYWATDVESYISDCFILFRTKLMSMGHKLAPRLTGGTTAQICETIDTEILDTLTEMEEHVRTLNFGGEDEPESVSTVEDDG